MNDKEIDLTFSKNWIKDKLTLPASDGGTYDLYIIEMPNEEGDETEPKRTFTVPVNRVFDSKYHEDLKYTYLAKERQYKIIRAEYDKENRAQRVFEACMMSAEEIKAVFTRYRDRKRKDYENSEVSQEAS